MLVRSRRVAALLFGAQALSLLALAGWLVHWVLDAAHQTNTMAAAGVGLVGPFLLVAATVVGALALVALVLAALCWRGNPAAMVLAVGMELLGLYALSMATLRHALLVPGPLLAVWLACSCMCGAAFTATIVAMASGVASGRSPRAPQRPLTRSRLSTRWDPRPPGHGGR